MCICVFGALLKQVSLFHYYACVWEIQHHLNICMLLYAHSYGHWHSDGTGVAEVMPSKACLVTQLFLNPEIKRVCRAGRGNANEGDSGWNKKERRAVKGA